MSAGLAGVVRGVRLCLRAGSALAGQSGADDHVDDSSRPVSSVAGVAGDSDGRSDRRVGVGGSSSSRRVTDPVSPLMVDDISDAVNRLLDLHAS